MIKIIEVDSKKYIFDIDKMKIKPLKARACANCGKEFIIVGRADTKYCENCKDNGAMNVYIANMKNNLAMKIYQKYYKKNYARTKYKSESKKMSKEKFEQWNKEALLFRAKALNNEITLEEFEIYLKTNREEKTND